MRWNDKLELGIEALDSQHKQLVQLAAGVYEAHLRPDRGELQRRLQQLITLASEHFVFEEEMMVGTKYPKSAVHSEHHAEILGQLDRFSRQLLAGRCTGHADRTVAFLNDWIASHIESFDRDFADYLAAMELSR